MSNSNSGSFNIKKLIKEYESKHSNDKQKNSNDKINITKFEKFLGEKNITLNDFYFESSNYMIPILENMSNSIKNKHFFEKKSDEHILLYKIMDIMSESNKLIVINDEEWKMVSYYFERAFEIILNMIVKVEIIMEEAIKNKNKDLKRLIDEFTDKLMKMIKVLFDKDYRPIESSLEKTDSYEFLVKNEFSRNIIYYILILSISKLDNKKKDNIENHKGSLKLIKSMIDFLIKEINPKNINNFTKDIEQIITIYKNHLNLITENIFGLLKKLVDLNSSEMQVTKFFDELFSFFFNNIVFEENFEHKYNDEFITILFELYKYLLEKKNKPLIDSFLIKLFFYIYEKNQELWGQRYHWLLTGTEYMKVVLDTFPEIFDEAIFTFYLGALINLMNAPKKKNTFLPDLDLARFFGNFEKYLNNKKYKKEYLITFFTKKICDLIGNNSQAVQIVLQKCNIFEIIKKLIDKEKEKIIKIKLIELLEKILSQNKELYEYSFDIKIVKEMNDDINYRLNIFTVGYEFFPEKYNLKISELIDFMTEYSKNKKFLDFIQITNFIFKIILEYQFKKINVLSSENLTNFNNLLLQMSMILSDPDLNGLNNDEKELNEYINIFMSSLFKFIIRLNLKKFEFKNMKYELRNNIYFTKRIIEKKTLKNIIKNLLLSQNRIVKKKAYEFLLSISIDEKNNLIISSYILYIIAKIYYQEKNYKCIQKLFDIIINLIKKFELNVKILLYNDFLSIILNILIELYGKENEYEEYYKSTFSFLEEISKYFNKNLLMKYLNKIFSLFNTNILSQIKEQEQFENTNLEMLSSENKREDDKFSMELYDTNNINDADDDIGREEKNDLNGPFNEEEDQNRANLEDKNEVKNTNNELCYILLDILKKHLENNNMNDNYLILSNYTFPNHLINNIIFFDNLNFKNEFESYIGFKMILRIDSYKGINGFNLLKLINQNINIDFIIMNNTLEIKEISEQKENNLYKIEKFDSILCPDGKYHQFIINFETKGKTFEMFIDDKQIIQKSSPYKYFSFDNFNALIGFGLNFVNDKENDLNTKLSNLENDNKQTKDGDVCFIYISYLLFLKTLIDNDKFKSIIDTEKNYSLYPNLLNYFYRIGNKNYIKNMLAEYDFQIKTLYLSYANKIRFKSNLISNFFCGSNNIFVNRYVACKKILNNFNNESSLIYMYSTSKNKNIFEYCSLNDIWKLEKINKANICLKIFDNYDTKRNLISSDIIDFLFGFLFLIEKRFIGLKRKNKEKEKLNQKDDKEEEELYLVNEDIVIDYITEILEIIFNFPQIIIKEYFNDKNVLKLKYFIYRNIFLFENEENFVKTILNIFSKNNFIFILFISEIFFDINIFSKLDCIVQNIIIEYLIEFFNKINFKKEADLFNEMIESNCFLKLMNSCINLIFFLKLSTYENDQGKAQFDLLIDFIELTMSKLSEINNENLKNTLGKFFCEINNICSDFEGGIKEHLTEEKTSKYKYIYIDENEDIEGDEESYINKKMTILSEQIKKYYNAHIQNFIIPFMNYYLEKNKITKECSFCGYFKKLFYEKTKFIYDEYNYIKLYNRFFRNYFQNFGNNSNIFDKNSYVWFLSLKESNSKMQNKLFLKENRIHDFIYENPKTKVKTLYFKYMIDEGEYKQKFKILNKLSFYDQICSHCELVNALNPYFEVFNYYNCLIIKKLNKILSTFIIYKDLIVIYYYICLDSDNKIHIVRNPTTSHMLWYKTKEDFKKELDIYINDNEKCIQEEIYKKEGKGKNTKPNLSSFNYTKNFKFSRRIIPLDKINEIHKRDHLHFPNSLEIFLDNGESYFIVFNPETRELVFDQIINNIDELYKSKSEAQFPIFKSSKLQTIIIKENKENKEIKDKENLLYMKHTPIQYLPQSEVEHYLKNYKEKENYIKKTKIRGVIDGNSFKDEICSAWAKNRINNYDYIMILNTFSGRTLNDLSQYFIFPWIIKDFNKEILNWLSSSIYRDLSLPIYACGNDIEKIKNKYELLDDEKYHSGTFYSAHSFVCYYLVRQHPFTEIHLEIQGARFDARARMFNGVEQLSELTEKFQEFIPHLFYFPELYIKINYILDDIKNDEEKMSDFVLPSWCKDDPRKFSLILRKLLESKNVSKNLNHWIDLIFGYQQRGPNAEKALNTYRNSTYPLTKIEIDKLIKSGEIESYLYEKEELGCIGKQLFIKPHKNREIIKEYSQNKKIFFNESEKINRLNQLKIWKIKENSKPLKEISFKKYNDIIFIDKPSLNNLQSKSFYQGGISSLPSLMNYSEEKNNSKMNKEKLIKSLDDDENYIILKKNYFFLSKYCLFLTYDKKGIELINLKEKDYRSYLLKENTEISCLTINSNGTRIFVGFSDGIINQYKIKKLNLTSLNEKIIEDSYINAKLQYQLEPNFKAYEDIFINSKDNFFKNENWYNKNIGLELISENNFNENNPHLYKRINLLALNESHNILIALDEANIIYIISLNNNCKLMHKNIYLSKSHFKMKEIIPLQSNGDFIIYSSYSVYLFSINGVPLCSLNLFEKEYQDLHIITCCRAVFIYDVTLFTAHKDGSIKIWKMLNKNVDDDFESQNKHFLKEYLYTYNFRNYMNSGINIREIELQRKFEEIACKNLPNPKKNKIYNNYVTFMKISNNLDFMILIDNEKNMYILNNNDNTERKMSFIQKFISKPCCDNCGKELIDDFGIRPSLIGAKFDDDNSLNGLSKSYTIKKQSNKKKNIICKDCEEKLRHTENYLYTY